MTAPLSDQAQTRLALACLFGALVQTLNERDKGVQKEFLDKLERQYRTLEDWIPNPDGAMEALLWTKQTIDPS
jgi:cell division FtsZ-interacting protein ZapD